MVVGALFGERAVLAASGARCGCGEAASAQQAEPLFVALANVMGGLVGTLGVLGADILPAVGGIGRCLPLLSNAGRVDF